MTSYNKYKVEVVENKLEQVHNLLLLHVGKNLFSDQLLALRNSDILYDPQQDLEFIKFFITEQYVNSFLQDFTHFTIEQYEEDSKKQQLHDNIINSKVVPIEIYTNLIYLIGRTGVYKKDDNDIDVSSKYFELAKYLGQEARCFEYILSQRNGEGIIQGRKIEEEIKALLKNDSGQDFANILKSLHEDIDLYTRLKNDETNYKLDYFLHKQKDKIQPSKDKHHVLECTKKLIKDYSLVIRLSGTSEKEQEELIELLSKSTEFLEKNKGQGKLSAELTASVLNTLGYSVMVLGEKTNPKLEEEINKLSLALLHQEKHLEQLTPKVLFEEAVNQCFDDKYPRADAYDGLYTFCKMNAGSCTIEQMEGYNKNCRKINNISDRDDRYGEVVEALGSISPEISEYDGSQ